MALLPSHSSRSQDSAAGQEELGEVVDNLKHWKEHDASSDGDGLLVNKTPDALRSRGHGEDEKVSRDVSHRVARMRSASLLIFGDKHSLVPANGNS